MASPDNHIPPHIKALVGMIACHAAGAGDVSFAVLGRKYKAKIKQPDGSTMVWDDTLDDPDAIKALELLDQSIIAHARGRRPRS